MNMRLTQLERYERKGIMSQEERFELIWMRCRGLAYDLGFLACVGMVLLIGTVVVRMMLKH